MVPNLRVGGERAECNVTVSYFNSAQLRQVPDVDVIPLLQLSGFKQHHQIGAAGERLPGALVASQNIERLTETPMPLVQANQALVDLQQGKLVGRAVLTP